MRFNRKLDRALRALLGCGSLILLTVLIIELSGAPLSPEPEPQTASVPGIRTEQTTPRTDPLPPLSDYAAIIERPLFTPDRRTHAGNLPTTQAAKTKKPAGLPDPSDLVLTAVIITEDTRMAILESDRGKAIHKMAQGESVNGWLLADIQPEAVSLKKGNEVKMLELRIQGSPPPSRRPRPPEPPREPSSESGKAEAGQASPKPESVPVSPPSTEDSG